MPNSATFFSRVSTWMRDSSSSMGPARPVVGTLWSATARVGVGAAHGAARRPQALECLRAGHLVDQVTVDI